ncbi:MAG: DUF1570 domain-containing protein [Planctomycetota bacterium]
MIRLIQFLESKKFWCAIAVIFASHLPQINCIAQDIEETKTYWESRVRIQQEFIADSRQLLESLPDHRSTLARTLRPFLIPRDPQRQYLFLPPENRVHVDPRLDRLQNDQKTAVLKVLQAHGQRILDLALQQAKSGDPNRSYQLLHEVLFFDPNHLEARKILGHRIIGDDKKMWRVKPDRLKVKRSTRQEKTLGWPEKTYWTAYTHQFQIVSNSGEESTRKLAIELEKWHDVWRQVFFEYHNSVKNLNRWIAGTSKPTPPSRKYRIVFFKNRDSYVNQLKESIPGIEASTGYYDHQSKTSYFFDSVDSSIRDTWKHELTHQLFQQSRRSTPSPFEKNFLWLGEGIAMYMESMVDHDDYFTVGGFDSRRLQYARMRRLKEQFEVPLEFLSNQSLQEFQRLSDIAKIYSQSAGVTHYLMETAHGEYRRSLIEFLKLIYRGRVKADSFENLLGDSFEEIESGYEEHLKLSPKQLDFFDPDRGYRELALIALPLEGDSLEPLNSLQILDWLDLSATNVRGNRLEYLSKCQIDQLFLTASKIDLVAAQTIASLNVKGIDLGGTELNDDGLDALSKSKTIRTLNITGSKVTTDGWRQFKKKRPDIEISEP